MTTTHATTATPSTVRALLSVGGLGLVPWAPGTVASLACVVLHAGLGTPWWLVAGSVVGASAITLAWSGGVTDVAGKGDPGWVVCDEWAGQALCGVPLWLLDAGNHLVGWTVALIAFRVLDIGKWGPVGWCERLPGAWGVLLDDMAAGVGAALAAAAVVWMLR